MPRLFIMHSRICLHLRVFDNLRPFLSFTADKFCKALGRTATVFSAELVHFFLDIRHRQHAVDVLVHALDHGRRQFAGPDQPVPGGGLETGASRFGHGRHTGVAFGARILPVRALGRCGGYSSDMADAIAWAAGNTITGVPANANPAKVIKPLLA